MTVHTAAFGHPVADGDDHPAPPTLEACAPDARASSSARDDVESRLSRRAIVLAVVAVAVVTAIAAGVRWFGTSAAAPVASVPPGVAGFAELYVATVLTAAGPDDPGVLAPFGVDFDGIESLTPYDRYVARVGVVDITEIGVDYWSVVVGAEVLPRGADGYEPGRLEFYAVGVAGTAAGLLATGPPMPVPAPHAATPPGVAGGLPTEADAPTARLVGDFLAAYFTGSRHLARLVTPDATIVAVADRAAVEVVAVRAGSIEGADWATATALVTDRWGGLQPVTTSVRIVSEPWGLRVAELVPGEVPLRARSG